MASSHDSTLPPLGEGRYVGPPMPRIEHGQLRALCVAWRAECARGRRP